MNSCDSPFGDPISQLLLSVRRAEIHDLPAVGAILSPEVVTGCFSEPCLHSIAMARIQADIRDQNGALWSYCAMAADELVGFATVRNDEISFLIDCRHWGKGYGSALLSQVLKQPQMRARYLYAVVDRDNGASRRMLEKNDFRFCGLIERDVGVGRRACLKYSFTASVPGRGFADLD